MIEFNRFLDISLRYCQLIDPVELQAKVKDGKDRNRISGHQFEHLESFGVATKSQVDPASSDEESEENNRMPSISKVTSRVIDTSSLVLSDNFMQTQHLPCFLLSSLPAQVNESQILDSCVKNQVRVKNLQIVDLNSQLGKAAFLWFDLEQEAKKEFQRFENGEIWKDDIFHIVRTFKWVDYRVLHKDAKFYAVVIRGFGKSLKPKELNRFFSVKFLRCEIRVIDGTACGVFVFDSPQDACFMCLRYHKRKDLFGNILKVNLHPLTLMKHSAEILEALIKGFDDPSPKNCGKDSIEILKAITQCEYNQREPSSIPVVLKLKRFSDTSSDPRKKKSFDLIK